MAAARSVTGGPVGRAPELAVLEAFLGGVTGSRALVLTGGPGIGKTTLWEAAIDAARERGIRVVSTRASGAEAQLAFAGLIDLLDGVDLRSIEGLPAPQLAALEAALLRMEPNGPPIDRGAVAFGFRNALRSVAAMARAGRRRRPPVAGCPLGPRARLRCATSEQQRRVDAVDHLLGRVERLSFPTGHVDCCWPSLSAAAYGKVRWRRSPTSPLSTSCPARACWSSTAVACESPIRCWRLPRPSIRRHASGASSTRRSRSGRGRRASGPPPGARRGSSGRDTRRRISSRRWPSWASSKRRTGSRDGCGRSRGSRSIRGLASAKRCQGIVQLANEYRTEAVAALAEATEAYELLGLRLDAARSLFALGRAQRRHRKWDARRGGRSSGPRPPSPGSAHPAGSTRPERSSPGSARAGRNRAVADPRRAPSRGAGRGWARQQGDRPDTLRVREMVRPSYRANLAGDGGNPSSG